MSVADSHCRVSPPGVCGQQHLDDLGSESLHILLAQGPLLYQLASLSSALQPSSLLAHSPSTFKKWFCLCNTYTFKRQTICAQACTHTHTHTHTHTLPQPHVIFITILFFLCLSLQNIWKFLSACLSSRLITPAPWPKLQLIIVSNNTLILTPQLLLRCPFH